MPRDVISILAITTEMTDKIATLIGKLKNIAEQRVAENTANASIAIAISNTSLMLQFL